MKYRVSYLFLCILFLRCGFVFAQGEGMSWYFGDKAAISFSTTPPTALTNSALTTNEGCATISDRFGNLLFYTDGIKVWNKNHQQMANGDNLAGDPSTTQAAIIVPKPLHANVYFVFTLAKEAEAKGLQYSEVDMNLNGGLGEVKMKNKFIAAPLTEKLTAVLHENKKDIWVIVHEWQSNVFRSYLITEKGLDTNAVKSATGFFHDGDVQNTLGYLKASPDGRYLASIIRRTSKNFELFDFDNATGKVKKKLSISGVINPYGVEFSPDISKLYTASQNFGKLYQVDLNAGDTVAISNSITLIAEYLSLNMSALQLAPDGKIYLSRAKSDKLSVINEPNLRGTACDYDPKGIDLKGRDALYWVKSIG